MSHLKRLRAPKSWPLLKRKGTKFIARPLPGPYGINKCITLNIILKDMLNYARTTRDSRRILNEGKILVNNMVRKSYKFPVSALDTLAMESLNEYYRVLYDNHGKFYLEKIKKDETETRLVKIKNKTLLKKNKTQLNFHNGTNLIVEKDHYKCGDSLLMVDKDIKKHLKFEKGAVVYLIGGKHKGRAGILENIEPSSALVPGTITIKMQNEHITTKKEFAFIIDKPFTK